MFLTCNIKLCRIELKCVTITLDIVLLMFIVEDSILRNGNGGRSADGILLPPVNSVHEDSGVIFFLHMTRYVPL